MSLIAQVREAVGRRVPIQRVPLPARDSIDTTWKQAKLGRIERALARALATDPGGWHVVGASTDLRGNVSLTRTVAGREVVLWRDAEGVAAGPGACPHMGALLADCEVLGGQVYCRWHGLPLGREGFGAWRTYPALDDGVLLWVRLPTEGEEFSDAPRLPARPDASASVAAVLAVPGTCEPRDIVANRLDPWHGWWFHPYAFSHLRVDDTASTDDELFVEVTFRLDATWGVPVLARFTCPDARTIVMHIVEGEGTGSVVETHATLLGHDDRGRPRTMMTEATIATSGRPGFRAVRWAAPLVRPLMRRTAAQLWVDDMEYAERRYQQRATDRCGADGSLRA